MRGSHFQLFIKDISCSLSNRLFSLLKLSSKTAHNPWNRGTKLKDKFNAHQPPLNSSRSLSLPCTSLLSFIRSSQAQTPFAISLSRKGWVNKISPRHRYTLLTVFVLHLLRWNYVQHFFHFLCCFSIDGCFFFLVWTLI